MEGTKVIEKMWDELLDKGMSDLALQVITRLNGYTEETMRDILFTAYGERQFRCEEESEPLAMIDLSVMPVDEGQAVVIEACAEYLEEYAGDAATANWLRTELKEVLAEESRIGWEEQLHLLEEEAIEEVNCFGSDQAAIDSGLFIIAGEAYFEGLTE